MTEPSTTAGDGYFSRDHWAVDYWGDDYWGQEPEIGIGGGPGWASRRKQKVQDINLDEVPVINVAARQRAEERRAKEAVEAAARLAAAHEAAFETQKKAREAAAKRARLAQRKAELKERGREEAVIERMMLQAAEEENRAVLAVVLKLAKLLGVDSETKE